MTMGQTQTVKSVCLEVKSFQADVVRSMHVHLNFDHLLQGHLELTSVSADNAPGTPHDESVQRTGLRRAEDVT